MMNRQRELATQIEAMGPRLPGAYSAICDFPRMDNDINAQATKRVEMKQLQEQVCGCVCGCEDVKAEATKGVGMKHMICICR